MGKPSSKNDLLALIEHVRDTPIMVIGDLILDRYVWGGVSRISPEAPVPVVDVQRVEDRLGGAANVAHNLANMGAKVWLSGVIGQDDVGQTLLDLLRRDGIESGGVVIDESRPTTLKTRVIASKQQVVRIDREDKKALSQTVSLQMQSSIEKQLEQVKAVIVSDYGKAAVNLLVMERLAGACDSLQLSLKKCPLVVDPHPANYSMYRRMSVAKPNRREAERAVGIEIHNREQSFLAAEKLLQRWNAELAMITLGEDGLVMAFADGRQPIARPTVAQSVFDVSGAGDTVTALFSLALAAGATPALAGDLANIGAGVVVSEVGTAPITPEKLRVAIEELHPIKEHG